MDEFENPPTVYLKAFNNGYTIARHIPELAEKLTAIKSDVLQVKGLRDGIQQHLVLEKEMNKEKDAAKEPRQEKASEKNTDKGNGKDDVEDYYPKWLKQDWRKDLHKDDDRPKDKDRGDLHRD